MFDDWGNPFLILRKVFKNPLTLFIYGIISKWYMIIMVGSLIVTYWVFDGLKKAGVLDGAESILVKAIEETTGVAQNCVPKINNLQNFWNCLSNPASSKYVPGPYDAQLQKDLQSDMEKVPEIPTSNQGGIGTVPVIPTQTQGTNTPQ
jgi:hypothetical protein